MEIWLKYVPWITKIAVVIFIHWKMERTARMEIEVGGIAVLIFMMCHRSR